MTDVPALRVSAGPAPAMLALAGASVRFGGLTALDQVSFTLARGEILGLIGPNGAGKTTAVNLLTGFQKPSDGDVRLGVQSLTGWSPDRIARAGIARTFQAGRLFRQLSVRENVEAAGVGTGSSRRAAADRAAAILDWLGLAHLAEDTAGSRSHGEQQYVGIARALALKPIFLLLDEPASGLNDEECSALIALIRKIPDRFGCGLLLIEHNMRVVMTSCQRVHVLDGGRSIAEGTPTQIRADEHVRAAYLGSPSLSRTRRRATA
jgi:branched-chain amino acid transport system ATP-binding protein